MPERPTPEQSAQGALDGIRVLEFSQVAELREVGVTR